MKNAPHIKIEEGDPGMTFLTEIRRTSFGNARVRVSPADLFRLRRQRRQLARLDDRALEDLGLSREEALREAERPIWDVPAHWRG
jgi:uncharacterized protein YjiS (DUF1127 family)